MPDALYVINGLIVVLIAMIAFIGKSTLTRVSSLEKDNANFINREQHDRLSDKLDKGLKEVYRHQDSETKQLRDEVNRLGESLRQEMKSNADSVTTQIAANTKSTNDLLTALINKSS